ncbi:MAG: RIP metalloprotease RseP, partial [Patescibacteria group bacterium]
SFGYQKTWKKIIVLVAGVTMNFLLAAALLSVGFVIGLPADMNGLEDSDAIIVQAPAVMIQQVEKNSPAEKATLMVGDKILSINSIEIKYSGQMVSLIKEIGKGELAIKISRSGEEKMIKAVLEGGSAADSRLGVYLADAGVIRYPWYLAVYKGFVAAGIGVINILVAFYFLFKNLIIGQGLSLDVSGPVGIAIVVGQSAKLGFNYLINVTAMISLSLAVINILPFPALDGGRAMFILIEKFTGKKVPLKYEQLAHTIGFALLMALIVVVTWRDVKGLF